MKIKIQMQYVIVLMVLWANSILYGMDAAEEDSKPKASRRSAGSYILQRAKTETTMGKDEQKQLRQSMPAVLAKGKAASLADCEEQISADRARLAQRRSGSITSLFLKSRADRGKEAVAEQEGQDVQLAPDAKDAKVLALLSDRVARSVTSASAATRNRSKSLADVTDSRKSKRKSLQVAHLMLGAHTKLPAVRDSQTEETIKQITGMNGEVELEKALQQSPRSTEDSESPRE